MSIGDWKEPFIRMPSLFELLPLTCFPWIVSLISVRLALALFLGPCFSLGLRRLLVRFLSIVRPEGLLSGGRSISKRESDGELTGKRRRLRTVRWALACLPMRSPSSSFWRYKGTEKISYHKTFRPKNAAKIENYFGQTEFYQGFHRFLYNGWYNLQNVLKHATPITVLQLQFFSRRGGGISMTPRRWFPLPWSARLWHPVLPYTPDNPSLIFQ